MTDNLNTADTGPSKSDPLLLAGAIELTPEARAILTKQVNRRIVWGHKFAKGGLLVVCGLPLLISVYFGYGFWRAGVESVLTAIVAMVLVVGPIWLSWFLGRWVARL